jgi:hypothetical protein
MWRKGVALRVRDLPPLLLGRVRSYMEPGEEIEYAIVSEMRQDGQVFVEFHCRKRFEPIGPRKVVIGLEVPEDPQWVCEGDLGRGMVEVKRRRQETE